MYNVADEKNGSERECSRLLKQLIFDRVTVVIREHHLGRVAIAVDLGSLTQIYTKYILLYGTGAIQPFRFAGSSCKMESVDSL